MGCSEATGPTVAEYLAFPVDGDSFLSVPRYLTVLSIVYIHS